MKKTKETNKEQKIKKKATWGDIVFRVLILVCIFFIALMFYALYIEG